ncbi:hypothetical protein D6774_03440 [Candidatus Woesearchaeota archaeon]|jgi:phosphate uptake regulator|nr:MAG: hypothetical protein D6774_03440 [Candidatus Woesearchaeota archaeon]
METRKLVKAGVGSFTISLPKSWLVKNNLERGSILYIDEKSDTELLITAALTQRPKEVKDIVISTKGKDVQEIQREITSAYVNNYGVIRIEGDDLVEKVEEVRKILNDYIGLEVIEQTASKIKVKDLIDLNEISVDSTIRRMDMIIRSIFIDALALGKNMTKSIELREYDINRLYFLLFRLVKNSLSNSAVAEKFKISNVQAMAYWYYALNLKEIGDRLKKLTLAMNEKNKKQLVSVVEEIQKSYLDLMKANEKKNKKLASDVVSRRADIIKKAVDVLKVDKETAHIIGNITEIETNICNLARMVIDSEV